MTKKVEDNATVIAVFPDKIKILVHNIGDFIADSQEEKLRVGSYLEIADDDEVKLIAIVERYSIEMIQIDNNGAHDRKYIIEAMPLGVINSEGFSRGGDQIALPPKTAKIASSTTIHAMYNTGFQEKSKFIFSSLSMNPEISVPVNGDQFFNKHIAIVGSTGSGKSHTVAAILQAAISAKSQTLEEKTKTGVIEFKGLNNSHIVIFDMHSEYKSAFPEAEILDINNLILPYWLLSSEELEEYFIDSEANDYNQRNIFKEAVIHFKKDKYNPSQNPSFEIHYDSPVMFDINDVYKYICDKNIERVPGANEGKTVGGSLYGKLTNFISRLENKLKDKRLDFFLGKKARNTTLQATLTQFLSYTKGKESNVTIIDLSGVPFEVLNITVSLISRLLFEYGFYYKKINNGTVANLV